MRNGGEDGEICRHSVAPLAWERGSHDIKKIGSRGSKKEPPGSQISTPGGSENRGFWALEASRGVLGGRCGSGGRSEREMVALIFFERAKKVFLERPGSILGSSLRLLGRFGVLFRGARGGSGRSFFEVL